MDLTPERFVALARSSPWRWRSLRLRVLRGWGEPAFRALVRRPDGLRVEALDGRLIRAERQERRRPKELTSTGRDAELVRPWAFETVPTFDDDGFVRRRPSEHEAQYDDPMLQDYRWVAMLGPRSGHRSRRRADAGPPLLDAARRSPLAAPALITGRGRTRHRRRRLPISVSFALGDAGNFVGPQGRHQ